MKKKIKNIICLIFFIVIIGLISIFIYNNINKENISKDIFKVKIKNFNENTTMSNRILTIDINGGIFIDNPGLKTIEMQEGQMVEIEKPRAPQGYKISFDTTDINTSIESITTQTRFLGWKLEGQGEIKGNVFTFGKGDARIIAEYEQVPVNLPKVAKNNFDFVGWMDGDKLVESPYVPSRTVKLKPNWKKTVRGFTIEKNEYFENEPIMIRASGFDNDWVGVFLKGEDPVMSQAIKWYYVNKDGNFSGDFVDITKAISGRKGYREIIEGDYDIYLFKDTKHEIIDKKNFKVKKHNIIKPLNATYNLNQNNVGLAEGKITIEANPLEIPTNYHLYWANDNGIIKDYTYIDISVNSKKTIYEMPKHTKIPENTSKMYIYSVINEIESREPYILMLPKNIGNFDFGKPIYEFQVLSDLHIHEDKVNKDNTIKALKDIKRVSPDSSAICINGDVVDICDENKYILYQEIINNSGIDPKKFFVSIGNHEYAPKNMSDKYKQDLFLKYTNNMQSEKVYFDNWINDYHYIFMGSEECGDGLKAYISDEQYEWLDMKINERKIEGKPIFLFLHQGIEDTVAGTFKYQGWAGIKDEFKFKNILKKHPEIILFTGHSHWTLQSPNNIKPMNSELPTILNSGSAGYLWDDNGKYIYGSQGYYVYVYKDKIIFKGRDFLNEKWISPAQYLIEFKNYRRKYNIKFDSNSGIGEMPKQEIFENETAKININKFVKEGYEFIGWNTKKDGTGIEYIDGQEIINLTNNNEIILYASWKKKLLEIEDRTKNLEILYDGEEHTLNMDLTLGATIKYSLDKSYNLEKIPKFKNVGEYIINYKVDKEGYKSYEGSKYIRIYGIKNISENLELEENIILERVNSFKNIISKFDVYGLEKNFCHYGKNNELINEDMIKTGDKLKIYINGCMSNEYVISLLGDANGDGKITSLDYIRIRKSIMGQIEIKSNEYFYASDINKDKKITSLDYIKIRKSIMNGDKLW